MVPATAGGTGETPVVPTGQILAELLFAGICTAGGTGAGRWYRLKAGSTGRPFSRIFLGLLTFRSEDAGGNGGCTGSTGKCSVL